MTLTGKGDIKTSFSQKPEVGALLNTTEAKP
jgi:hypothetical protein